MNNLTACLSYAPTILQTNIDHRTWNHVRKPYSLEVRSIVSMRQRNALCSALWPSRGLTYSLESTKNNVV